MYVKSVVVLSRINFHYYTDNRSILVIILFQPLKPRLTNSSYSLIMSLILSFPYPQALTHGG